MNILKENYAYLLLIRQQARKKSRGLLELVAAGGTLNRQLLIQLVDHLLTFRVSGGRWRGCRGDHCSLTVCLLWLLWHNSQWVTEGSYVIDTRK